MTPSPSVPPGAAAQLYAQHKLSCSVRGASLYPVPFLQVLSFVEAAFVGDAEEPADVEVLGAEAEG